MWEDFKETVYKIKVAIEINFLSKMVDKVWPGVKRLDKIWQDRKQPGD